LFIKTLSNEFIYFYGGDGGGESSSEKLLKNKSTSLANFEIKTLSRKLAKALTPYPLKFW